MTSLAGTGGLVRLILRRDRVLLPIWIGLFVIIPSSLVGTMEGLYPTAADLARYADTSGTNPTLLALYGPVYSSDLGGVIAQRAGSMPVILALISIVTVIRHTRADEEAGRRELLGATVVGRHAGVAAALIVTMGADLLIALLIAAGMAGQGLPVAGSAAFGLAFALAGCVFAAVAAVAAQLTEGSGAARGIAIAALGAAFVVRVAGDVGGKDGALSWLSWLSPLGWSHLLRPYAAERWWVPALAAATVVALIAATVALSARRDVGGGVFAQRPGPAMAAPGLRGPFGLAWRLHRSLLLGWSLGFVALGVIYGSVADGIRTMLEDSPELERYLTRIGGASGIVDAYFATIMSLFGLIAAGYAVQAALRLRAEESALRAEPVLATSVSRLRWAGSHLLFSALGPVLVLGVGGLAAGLSHGLNSGDPGGQMARMLGGALVQLPAVWLLAGIAVALFGLVPRAAALAWGALALFFVLGQFGAALNLSQPVIDLSPFTHIPKLPGAEVALTPLAWLLAIAAILAVAGLVGVRRRDLAA